MNSIAVLVVLVVLNGLYFSTTSNHQKQRKTLTGQCTGVCFAGKDGRDGKDGQTGNPGNPGQPGRDGQTGKSGNPGQPGRDGTKGTKGEKGDKGLGGVCDKNCQSAVKILEIKLDEMYKKFNQSDTFMRCAIYEPQPLGMNSHAIKDAQLTASSVHRDLPRYGPHRARLNVKHHAWGGYGWAAKDLNVNQWLQVNFGKKTYVSGMATQGFRTSEWVKTYQISFSDDGSIWKPYKEDGRVRNFNGNNDGNTVVKHNLRRPVLIANLRFLPKTWHTHISMRMEVYGCYL